MSERLIELYKEASEFAYKVCKDEGRAGGTNDHIWNSLSTGRFAELIVQECANELLKWKHEPFPFDPDFAAQVIKKHFGVN